MANSKELSRDNPCNGPLPDLISPVSPRPGVEESEDHSTVRLVNWDDKEDDTNPMNWAAGKKWRNIGIISAMTIITPLCSAMFAPSVPQVMKEFQTTSNSIEIWVVSIFVLGFAVGPLFVAPMSEIYGRRPVYLISNAVFCIFTIACAVSSNIGMLIAFRFLAGCGGSTPLTLGGATVADMFPKEKRGAAMASFAIGPLLGPAIGPVIGGYLAQARGWRWIFWLQTIVSCITLLLGLVLLQETYAVYILEQKTRKRIRETGDSMLKSALHDGTPAGEYFKRAIFRPGKMLLFSPIILMLSIYVAIIFGYLYVFITTFPRVFTEQYDFTTGQTGLTYLGLGLGCFLGLVIMGKTSDRLYNQLTLKNGGLSKPEFRLPPLLATSPLIAIAFFMYGWASQEKVHWIVPIVGTTIFGIGMMPTFISVSMYLVDTYTRYAASAIAATKVLQSIFGAVLPLVGPALYNKLGLGWGNSVLAFIALGFMPVPWLFFTYGEKTRMRYAVKL